MTTLTLPTEPTKPQVDPLKKPILVYGRKKAGKSTLAAELDAERTLFLATEPGTDHIKTMRQAVRSWEEFLTICRILAEDVAKPEDQRTYNYRLIVIDTVDELARMCGEHVTTGLNTDANGRLKNRGFVHASDFDYGKGWDAIASEFRLKIANLVRLGMGVVFISHTKEQTVKTRTGAELTKYQPDVGQKGMRNWLLGFVEFIAFADIIKTKEGEERVLQLAPTEAVEAGGRVPRGVTIPDQIPLDAAELRKVLELMAG